MQIKSILAGAAIALAASIGSASAADQFTTLHGITAEPMRAEELGSTRGGQQTGIAGIPAMLPTMDIDFGVGYVMLRSNGTSSVIVEYPAENFLGDHINNVGGP